MGQIYPDIRQMIEPAKFNRLQDNLSQAVGLAVIAIDYSGRPLTNYSRCTPFCAKMRASKMASYCQKCDARGGLEAVRSGQAYYYLCHAGLVDIAVPMMVEGVYVGAFMVGQALPTDEREYVDVERMMERHETEQYIASQPQWSMLYDRLPKFSLSRIKAVAGLLDHFSELCTNHQLSCQMGSYHPKPLFRNLIQPSLTYIENHLDEKITLTKMAALCHVSPSYYSKLFASQKAGSLSAYVNRLKVERAKKRLRQTEMSVGHIGRELGFDDAGYFIKVFKKEVGMTPLAYRQREQR